MSTSEAQPQPGDEIDLTNCDREPIHILGRVQSFGALVSVTQDWIINHISRNIGDFLTGGSEEAVGTPLSDLVSRETIHQIRGRMQLLGHADAVERIFGISLDDSDRLYDVAVHISGTSIIIELEHHSDRATTDYVSYVRPMIDRVQKAGSHDQLCKIAARQLKALIGFDRVMVYEFGEDGTGEVVAEALNADMEAFKGLRYPASDIPKQAREMYKRSLLRIISDVNDIGIEIHPQTSPEGTPLDLSMSATRAVSQIHLEYLKNMGVGASLSISILVRGELWGMFACHHNSPRILSYELRSAAELFAQLFSFILSERHSENLREHAVASRILHDQIMAQLADGATISSHFDQIVKAIEDIIPHTGAVSWVDGEFVSRGQTPTEAQFKGLSKFLNTSAVSQIFVLENISACYPEASAYADVAAGMLALPVSRSPRDYLVFFRGELKRDVKWAGNPDKPVTAGPNGARLTPRKSFEAWQETISGFSAPWTSAERSAAENLRITLLEVVLRMTDSAMRERSKAQEQQELLIAELNHRIRNILNLIRGLISQSSDAHSVGDFTQIVGGRIHALARAHDQITKENWAPASLHTLLLTEADAFLGTKADRLVISGPDALLEPTAFTTLSLVMHEMITNSAKYGALVDGNGRIDVSVEESPSGAVKMSWRETGGPPVAPPTRKGFGTTIIDRSIPYELGGSSEVSFNVTGVTAEFTIPGSFISSFADPADTDPAEQKAPEAGVLSGDVLILEDNMIIALDAEDIAEALGADRVFVCGTVNDAMRIADDKSLQFALLDVNLGAETSERVAEELQKQGVQFLFATGYGDRTALADKFPDVPVVQKPFNKETIANAVAQLN